MADEQTPNLTPPVEQGKKDERSKYASHIEVFIKRVDSLADTLPMTMTLQQELLSARRKELNEFIERHCQREPGGDGHLVPVDYFAAYRRLDDKTHKAFIAMSTIPRSFLVALISDYDAFLSALIRVMYVVQPNKLKESAKPFTFAELVEFGSIEAVREHIIEKEAESVLRESHTKQFEWLEDAMGITLRTDLPAWAPFVEITERRNLFVHNDGVVTGNYLKNCKKANCDIGTAKLGDRLEVPHRYFIRAHETVSEIALKLAYVMWNKYDAASSLAPQAHLNTLVYEFITQRKYRLAIQMATFALKYMKPFAHEYSRLSLTVNLAQAYKWSGGADKCVELLAKDWSAHGNEFQLAVAVLRDDFDEAARWMERIGTVGVPEKSAYRDWPLFQEARKSEKIQQAFQRIFGEPLNQVPPPKENNEGGGDAASDGTPAQDPGDGTVH